MGTKPKAAGSAANLETLFLEHLASLRQTIDRVCRRYRLRPQDAADFASWAFLKILSDDYAVLRAYSGRSRISTYLHVVVLNLFRDYRNSVWGKWRPTALARRLGEEAMQLERLIRRDQLDLHEAVEVIVSRLGTRTSRAELEAIAARLDLRSRHRFESLAGEPAASQVDPEDGLQDLRPTLRRARGALTRALTELTAEDQEILRLHFGQGLTMAAIARRLRLHQRSLYTRRDRCLGELRRALEEQGLTWREIEPLIGRPETTMDFFEQAA